MSGLFRSMLPVGTGASVEAGGPASFEMTEKLSRRVRAPSRLPVHDSGSSA